MSDRLQLIAIDGPSGSGKSTAAKRTAQELGWSYLDTGAMYRSTALAVHQAGMDLNDRVGMDLLLDSLRLDQRGQSFFLNDVDVSQAIRSMEISKLVTPVSADIRVRQAMVREQQALGQRGQWVVDGRDIGTVVFPNACCKIFLVASLPVRTYRRFKELTGNGISTTLAEVQQDLERRDMADSTRAHSPLRKAEDALEIDTSEQSIELVVGAILEHLKKVSPST